MTENNKTENNRRKLYDALQPHISNIGTWNDFNARMDNEANRRKVYEAAQKYVANIGAWDDFNARVYDAPAVAAGTEATAEVANGTSFAIESNGSNESNMAAASTQSNLSDVQKSINEARLRRIQGSWDSFIADSHDRVQRIAGSLDPKERERRERARFAARAQYGLNPDVMPFGSGKKPAEDSDESQAQSSDSNNGNRLTPMSSPEVYDVTLDADGKPSVRWQLADGSLTERRIEAAEQESQAKQWRLMKAFEGRMKQNGLDLSNQEHVKQQALIDAINGGRIDGEQRDELRKEFAGNGLDVDNKEHVAWMVTGNTRKILEYRLTVAEDRLKSLVQQRQANKDKQTDEQPWYLKIGAAFQEGNSNMHPTPRGSHAGLADNKVDKEIEEATAEVAALSRSISHYDRNTSAKDKGWFGKVLQGLWDGITDPNTWSMGVVDMSVNSTMAHADDASDSGRRLLESGVMAQQLEAEAPNPGGFYSGGHFAGELVGDPSNWFITGAASKAATLSARAAVNVMAKRTAKGMTREVAERFVKSKLRNRLLIAGASQAGFFGAFDGLRDMRQQVIDGGWTDAGYTDEDGVYHPGEFHSGFSPWHAASAAGRGSAIGFGMGFFGAGWGNVASKMVGATGGVNRVLAYGEGKAIGFEIESTVFAAPDMISYMTMDDAEFDRRYAASYGYADETDPSKRDKARRAARGEMIVDAWTESQANLLALKLGGKMMTPGAGRSAIGSVRDVIDGLRVRDARDHRTFKERVASIIGSSPYDITLKQSDIDELRDAGYDADLFRSDGPVEVMERNADESFSESGKAESVGAVPGLDGYEMAQRLMEDTTVPQEVRAKVYYIVTGHVLPKGTVMGYRKTENDDGSQTVEALTANGEVISRHEYTSAGAAEREVSDLERQVELNTVEVGERGRSSAIVRDITRKACEEVAKRHGWVVDDVVSAYERAVKDISGKEAETDGKEAETTGQATSELVAEVEKAAERYSVEMDSRTPEGIREGLKKETEIDVDEVLRKERESRSEEEQEVVERYVRKLYEREGGDGTYWQERLAESSKPIGRAVMKFQSRPVEVLSGRVVMMKDGTMVDKESSDATVVVRDVATGKVEMVAPEAILSYENYAANISEGTDAIAQRVQEAYQAVEESFGEEAAYWMYHVDEHPLELVDNPALTTEQRDAVLRYIDAKAALDVADTTEAEAERPQDAQSVSAGVADGTPETMRLERNDRFRLSVAGGEETQIASVVDRAGDVVTVWTPSPITEKSKKAVTMPGYTTQIGHAELVGMVVRDAEGKPVDYVAAEKADETQDFNENSTNEEKNGINLRYGNESGQDIYTATGEQGRNSVQPVATDAAGVVEVDRDRSAIRSYEEGLAGQHHDNTEHSERDRREAESERLVSIAKANGERSGVKQDAAPRELSPLERIPRDEKGVPVFEQAESAEVGWDALVEFSEGDAATAKEIADTMSEEKRKAYEKAQKLRPKGKTPTEILASKKAISAELAQAEQEYNLWHQMAGVEQLRQAAIRAQQEAEVRQRAAERAEAEKAEREAREEAARLEREALEGIPEWHLDTPENARKRGVRRFSGQMFTRQEPVQGVVGKEVEVKFSQKDLPKGHLAVIEAAQLQPSHIQGQRNPMFFIEEAQPKNRAEAVSMFAAKEMAEGIRPQEITGSATAYTGAPTVNTRGEVIQGNNRSDALRYLWENKLPEQQQTYKQYLIDNAEQFGLAPEAVNAMQQPVLVNMLDVDDAEAIRLGQMTAQDTESGGIERIKPKNVAQKLGEDMRSFASQLLRSGDEEASFGQLVDRNGTEVLKWMAQKGAITNTQYQSAFDSKGNLTAEAKNDLQKVLYQAVFKGGSQQLEEMFDALPAKAQRAILSTAFRDMDSPVAGKMLPEIQASIVAFNQLMNGSFFATAKKMEEVLMAVEGFKRSILLDDRFEQYMPADNFSNFALHLAAMYKANDMSQSTLASYFNQMYDLAQGKKAATLFEEADTTEYPLADVIKQVLNIDYKPAKNGNNNVANGGADVALRNQDGQGGELRGNEPPTGGEQNPTRTEASDRGAGTSDDSRGGGNLRIGGKGETAAQKERLTKEEASGIIAEMEEKAIVAPEIELTIENWDAQFGKDGIVSTPIGNVKMGENQFTKLMRQGRSGKFGMIKLTLELPDIIIEDASEAKDVAATERDSSYVFVKTFVKSDGARYYYFTSVTVSKDGHEVVISNQEKRRNVLTNLLMKGKLVWKHADDASSASDVADGLFSSQRNMSDPVPEGTDAPQTNDSERKVNNSASEKQVSGQESSLQLSDNGQKRQAEREGGRILTLSEGNVVGNTSQGMSTADKDNTLSADEQSDEANAKPIRNKKVKLGAETEQTIEDFGEEIAGARKDMLRDVAKSIENVTIQSLIELPMSKAFKKPSLKKMLENGVITDEDAVLAEAIMQGLIYGKKKPALTRRPSSKREIASWAEETYKGIKMLGDILSGDAGRRGAAMTQHRKEVDEKTREAKVHIANLRKWNPGKEFKDVESAPDAVDVIRRVLEGVGYKAGDKVDLPLTRVEMNRAGNGYNVSSPGKQGAYWFKRYHDTLEEAIETMVLAGKLSRGDMDAEIPQRQYSIRGTGEAHQEPTGKYVVMYLAKNGYKEVVFGNKEKAEEYAKAKNGKVVAQQRRTNKYDSYQVVVINPLTGNSHVLKDGFDARHEASAWLDESPEEINGMALEAIYKETGTKREPRAHFYVTSTYSRGKMIYSVVENDKCNPWPDVKDFSSYKEAESWLKENIERLEAERKQRKEAERAVVYYNTARERAGEDYRKGEDATPENFSEAFGFRGVQFGNWTNAADRQAALNQAYDALMDLAHILNVPARALSLDGELGLAFGARGGGRASAHYEPVEVVINLTKTQGAGALAHEWWHALDNYLSRRAGVTMGYASHRNGTDKMSTSVKEAIENLMSKVDNSDYAKRSRVKGEYWGRGTEVMARLFESWVAWKMGKNGKSSPFLSTGINPKSQELYQTLNYFAYRANEKRRAEREGREPAIMSKEEFDETPESLSGYPYPTEAELAELAPQVEALFSAVSERESESGSMAGEPRRRYRDGQMTGKSLFDWVEGNERQERGNADPDEQIAAAEKANGAIDEYAVAYNEYVEETERLERGLAEAGTNEEVAAIREQMESSAKIAVESGERLYESLKEYYVRENTPEDAERIARDMVGRVEAEVRVSRHKEQVLSDILDNGTAVKESAEIVESESERVMTGGGYISYNAVGHLPEAKVGEFAYVERQFSRSGEFMFTGNGVIRDRGDVAYIFRSLENYSVENVFAVFVKDGRGHILHIGMGGPLASYADMGAIRAGYDAFGADEIYLVHNHPSGVMKASAQDRNLMRKLEAAFDGKVKTEGIIMDTTSGRYVTFDGNNKAEVAERPREGGNVGTEVMRFDGVERYGEAKKLTHIRTSEDVARFVSEHRLGTGDKVSYMVLSNNNDIIGNFHTDYGSLEAAGLADEMASVATKFGGTSVIAYGNVGLKGASRLGEEVGRKSLTGVRLLDAIEITNGLNKSAVDEGLMSEGVAAYGSEAREPMVSGRGRDEFAAMREQAVAERGIVAEGLNEKEVRVVDVPRHDFRGTRKEALKKAEAWAKENIAGVHTATDSRGEEFEYSISNGAIEKYVSRSATDKSANVGVHLSALKMLPEIIAESVEAEVHPDYKKGEDGQRRVENGYNSTKLIHRYYGAINIDGTVYRVKTTMEEFANKSFPTSAHSYEVTEIEAYIAETTHAPKDGAPTSTSAKEGILGIANLLKGVDKSYDAGKKLLDESERRERGDENIEDGELRYRDVDDEAVLKEFAEGKTVKAYRTMQVIDGKLYSPMATKVGGKTTPEIKLGVPEQAEEHPEVIKKTIVNKDGNEQGIVVIDKGLGKGTLEIAYNPYVHTSRTVLNDQFSSAYKRPNLVTVEVEVPESELKSGYRADKAKNAVGEMSWHSGSVSGQLAKLGKPRRVILSRYDRPVRIVPFKEVAAMIAEQLDGTGIAIPYNVVQPQVREELERLGVAISEEATGAVDDGNVFGKAEYVTDKELERINARQQEMAQTSEESKRRHAEMLAQKFNTPIRIVTNTKELTSNNAEREARMRRSKGFYDPATGKVVVVLPNNANVDDVAETVFHEVVAHKGLREMLGEGNYDAFCDEVYAHLKDDLKEEVDRETTRQFEREPEKGYEHARRVAVDELFGRMAEKGFEDFSKAEKGIWAKLKEKVLEAINKFLGTLKLPKWVRLGDNELRYMLWRSHEKLRGNGDYVDMARDVAKRDELGLNRSDVRVTGAETGAAKEEIQATIDKLRMNPMAFAYVNPDNVAMIVDDFENPTFEGDEDVKFRDGADYVERVPGMARAMYEKRIQASMYQVTEAMQDSMRGLMEFYKAVESQGAKRGIEDVSSYENAYIAENLMSSKSHAEMEEYERNIMRPLLDIAARMSKNKKGRKALTDYMMAKHGLERNAYMRNEAIANGKDSERDFAGLCGLTGVADWHDAEAAAKRIVDSYEIAHSADIAELWNAVNKATKASLKKVYDSGLLSKEQYEKIRDMYDFYIPLRGFDEKTSEDVYGYLTSKKGAFSSPLKKAEGRKSKADDPLAMIAYMAQNCVIQGNRNVMKQKFLTYVQNHPSDLASVNKLWLAYDSTADIWNPVFADIDESMTPDEIEQEIKDFEERMESLSQSEPDKYKRGRDAIGIPYRIVDGKMNEHQVVVKRNGESFVITINGNPRAAQAVNGLTNPDNDLNGAVGMVFKAAGAVNRQLSQFYTTRNPDFVVSNFIRDLIYSNTMVHIKENQGYAMKFHKNHARVNPIMMVRLLHLYEANKLNMHKPIHRMFYEFMHWGGETGYTMQRDLEQEKKLVAKIIKESRRWRLNPMRVLRYIGNKLDQLNRGVENSARFAAYITSREVGRDVQRSVYDAKEISVNFNKKGAGSKFMEATGQSLAGKTAGFTSGLGRSFYVFWNAAVQGTANYGKAFKKHPVKAITSVTALVLLGYIMAALMDDGEDEDETGYYNIPKYTRRSNLMFRSGEQWITIPLPVEYRALYGLGELAYSVTSGREEYSDAELAKEMATQFSQVLPLDFMEGGGGLHAFVPSAVKPLAESATNTSWTGLPIYKDTPFNEDMPEWTKAYPRTSSQLVDLSKRANEASGGNDYKAGWANINPAQLEYLLRGYFGGPANFVDKMIKTGEMMLGERDYDPSSILLVNRLVKTGDERTADKKLNSDFYKYHEEYKRTHNLLRKYEDEAKRGSEKYRIFLEALKHSYDGTRHDVMEKYISGYNRLNRALKDPENTEEDRAEYEARMRKLKREVVSLMKVASDSVELNRLREQLRHENMAQ